ncbi:hypothetical protein [Allosphingosinicella indica]|uniref:Uncharacterized protein n=1 Tax=Allosphingosinicella indica TaxID=941907 RepID=A0A1X7G961_9SPHN|nr:hypothetical protein [Allosphingosinicella indica]SMF66186.1 hypothetical protein SAMN06295910_1373 [Allosphingosinicella indica]
MTDDDEAPLSGEDRHRAETLLYDHFKFLTTLSLLALGGVLTLSQSGQIEPMTVRQVLLVLAPISIGGACALSGATGIVAARHAGKEPRQRQLGLYRRVSVLGIGIGTGGFLALFMDALR